MPKKGYKQTKEHKRKIRINGFHYGMKGKHHSEETRKKISEMHKGKVFFVMNDEIKKKISNTLKGHKNSEESRRKNSESHKGKSTFWTVKGKNHYNWKGGITPVNDKIRRSKEFKLWRETVFIRDNYTCQKCKLSGGKLCSHHIFNFWSHIDLRFIINNGITLCRICHNHFHKIYGKKNNTSDQLKEFLK